MSKTAALAAAAALLPDLPPPPAKKPERAPSGRERAPQRRDSDKKDEKCARFLQSLLEGTPLCTGLHEFQRASASPHCS